jgi:glycosyltransferase involved in cell wall biosynthesis
MRVLAYSNIYPSSYDPTRGIYNFYRFSALAKYCDVRVVCPVPWRTRLFSPRELILGCSEHQGSLAVDYPTFVPIVRLSRHLNPILMHVMTRHVVARLHAKFPFDVVLASWGYPDAVAALRISREYNCPQVTQLLGSDLNVLAKVPAIRKLISQTLCESAGVLTMSSAMAQAVEQLGVSPSRVTFQHNGVDQDSFRLHDKRETRARLNLPLDSHIIVCVGNLVPIKGIDVLVDAFARLTPDLQQKTLLVLVGDGPSRQALELAVLEKNLTDKVRFLGRRLHTEIPEWIGAADVLCLPSLAEGCPNVVLEAFASGRPVVASAVGAVPKLVTPIKGRIVAPGQAVELAAALGEALVANWDAETIRSSIADLTWESVGRRYFEILSAAVDSRRHL